MVIPVIHNGSEYQVECNVYKDTVGDYYGNPLEVSVVSIHPLPYDYYEREEIEDIAISQIVHNRALIGGE